MERSIPHVLDVFTCSPGARRRVHASELDRVTVQIKDVELQKNPGNDSAISVGSSDDDDEDQKNIAKYFDYLNEDDGDSISRRKKKKRPQVKDPATKFGNEKDFKAEVRDASNERSSRKTDFEKDIRYIERHLSMKKTIRKKMMRDLQQAFVEDPGDFQQDQKNMAPEKKNNIDIRNLTISKNKLSKSEHNFLDMLKDGDKDKEKEKKKGIMGYMNQKNKKETSIEVLKDDDSGNGSPSREASPSKSKSRPDLREDASQKEKTSFWKKLTGKGKNKR